MEPAHAVVYSVYFFTDGSWWDFFVTPDEQLAKRVTDDFNHGVFTNVPHAYPNPDLAY